MFLTGILVPALALALGSLYWSRQEARRAEQQRAQQAMEVLWETARRISIPLQAYYLASLHRLSANPGLAELLAAEDAQGLETEAATLIKAFPAALALRLLPAGWEPSDAETAALGYATLEMLRQAETSRLRPPVEARFLSGAQAPQMIVVQPVFGAAGQVVGEIMLLLPWKVVEDGWAEADTRAGYLELQQSGRTMQTRGARGAATTAPAPYQLGVENTRWTLAYWPPPPGIAYGPWILAVAAAAVPLLGVVALWLIRRRAAERDELTWGEAAHYYAQASSKGGPAQTSQPAAARPRHDSMATRLEPGAVAAASSPAPVSGESADHAGWTAAQSQRIEVHEVPAPYPAAPMAQAAKDWSIDIRLYDEPAADAAPPAPAPPTMERPQAAPEASEPALEIDWEVSSGVVFEPQPQDGRGPIQAADAPWCPVPSAPLHLPPELFGAWTICGVAGEGLTAENAYHVGRAVGSEAAGRGIGQLVVAHDGRQPSETLAHALTGGLVTAGARVTDLGRVPTPVLDFAAHHLGIRSGVMVTGADEAEGPSEIRVVLDGDNLSADALQSLYRRITTGEMVQGDGGRETLEILPEYLDRITSAISLARPFRLVVDCGNGITGAVAPRLFRAMGCEVVELFTQADGRFPHHRPDPSDPANLQDLVRAVQQHRADLGLAFDGDGDRLGVVDDQGTIVWPDRQMMLYATDVLARNPGASIVYDVRSSANLARVITQHRGHAVLAKAGPAAMRAKMREVAALLAGDTRGHIFFRERWYGFSDALYAGARLLRILARIPGSVSSAFAAFPGSVVAPEVHLALSEDEAGVLMQYLIGQAPALEKERFAGAAVSTVDGLRVDFNDRSALLQMIEATGGLSVRCEALTPQALQRIQEEIRALLTEFAPAVELPF